MSKQWVILVADYGAFLFSGTEEEAEQIRRYKANWKQGVAKKRPARPEEIDTHGVICTEEEKAFFGW